MSPSPDRPDEDSAVANYAAAWSRLMALVRQGYSWSGHERNVAYLNTRDGRFADVASVSGLDFPDDGRALAVTDWDRDGDLDLWFRNRTAPRLRLLRKQGRPATGEFVALRLEGTSCNRDAVGSSVELVVTGGADRPLVRSVRAGDLFLSQSSKWLHFGLADGGQRGIERCTVLWPGGSRETFNGVVPGGRFVLRQGSGAAEPREVDPVSFGDGIGSGDSTVHAGSGDDPAAGASGGAARVVLAPGVLLPTVSFRDPAARPQALTFPSKPRLLVLWSAGCPKCREDLETLGRETAKVESAGVDIIALSVDALEGPAADTSAAYELVDALALSFPWGFLDGESAARLAGLEAALFDRIPPSVVPFVVLLDQAGEVLAIHRGAVRVDEILEDTAELLGASDESRYHLAPPFAGRWFTRPMPRADVAEFMARQFRPGFPDEAMRYLMRAHGLAEGERRTALSAEIGRRCLSLARELRDAGDPAAAGRWLEQALEFQPDSAAIRYDLAVLLAQSGRLSEAEAQFLEVLAREPDSQAARESLEMVRKARLDGRQ